MKEPIDQRSKYWLSPGIDVPTYAESPFTSPRPVNGFWYEQSEATFVPSRIFMAQKPLWRVHVINDIIADLQRTKNHALVAFFREIELKSQEGSSLSQQINVFREICARVGVEVPGELETLFVRDHQFRSIQD